MIARSVGPDDERTARALRQTLGPMPHGNLTDEDAKS